MTAGLGGMSGAQAKAAVICGCVGVIAEVGAAAALVVVGEFMRDYQIVFFQIVSAHISYLSFLLHHHIF